MPSDGDDFPIRAYAPVSLGAIGIPPGVPRGLAKYLSKSRLLNAET